LTWIILRCSKTDVPLPALVWLSGLAARGLRLAF